MNKSTQAQSNKGNANTQPDKHQRLRNTYQGADNFGQN
jgi:hypothetical protein